MSAKSLGSRAIVGQFYATLAGETAKAAWLDKLAFRLDSNQESETLKWLGQAPAMREWVGGRQAKGLRDNGFTILNKVFEATERVSVDDLRRDKTGQILVRIDEMAQRAADHPASLISTLINNGGTGICYDGQYFFDTDHAEGENTTSQANLITFDISDNSGDGLYTTPGPKTMQKAIFAAIAAMMGFKDDQNEPMNQGAREFIAMVPTAFMASSLTALTSPILDSGQTNPLVAQNKFKIDVEVNPRLTFTDSFCVFRADGKVKPFVNQVEVDTHMTAIAEGSEHEAKEREHIYGVERIGNAAYGYWQHAVKVTLQA